MKKLLATTSAVALSLAQATSFGMASPLSMTIDRTANGGSGPYPVCANVKASFAGCMPIGTITAGGLFSVVLQPGLITADKVSAAAKSGDASVLATVAGTLTNGHCVSLDGAGNLIDAGAACAAGGGGASLSTANKWTAPQTFSAGALANQLQTFSERLQGAICDGAPHPLSASYGSLALAQVDYPGATALTQEKDEAAFYSATSYMLAAPYVGGEVSMPSGTCRFTGPAAFSIAEGQSLKIRGQGFGTRLLFPAGSGNRGLAFTFQPMASSTDSATLVPSAQVSDLQLVTQATANAGGGTALYATNGSATGSQYVHNGIPQLSVSHVLFTALSGGGHAGASGSWAVGLDVPGLWYTDMHDSFFQGGLSGSSTASNNDTTSIFERITSTGQSTAASAVHVNHNNAMSYGGTFLKAGDVNTTSPLQGIDIVSATTAGIAYDVVFAVLNGGDWITVSGSNFNSSFGSVITNPQTFTYKGNYCIGNPGGQCLTLNNVGRTFIGAGSQFIVSSPAIVVNNSASTPTFGGVVLDGNQFAQMSGPSIRLTGSTSGVVGMNNTNSGTNAMFDDQSTGKSQLIGWNQINGRWSYGPTGSTYIDQSGNVVAPSITATGALVSAGQSRISNGAFTDPSVGGSYDLKLGGSGNGFAVNGASVIRSSLTLFGNLSAPYLTPQPTTVANLPACDASTAERIYYVVDSGNAAFDGKFAICHNNAYTAH